MPAARGHGVGSCSLILPEELNFADASAHYRELLVDESSFRCVTIEELLDERALPESTSATLRDRYIPD